MSFKCEKSAKICKEWAADFRQQGLLHDAGIWEAMAIAFRGINVVGSEETIELVINDQQRAVLNEQRAESVIINMYGANSDVLKSAREITKERQFLIKRLEKLLNSITHQ